MWRSLFESLFSDPLALDCVRDGPFRKVVPRLLPVTGEPWCIEQSTISSVLNLCVCRGLISSVTVFIRMRLIFHSFDFACLRDVPFWKRLFRGSSQEWVNPGAWNSQWLAPFWVWVCLGLFSFKTVFIWMSLFFDPFHFACVLDVPFGRRLFWSSSQEWVNPGGWSSQGLVLFWAFEFALDFFRLKRSLFEWAFLSTHLILGA